MNQQVLTYYTNMAKNPKINEFSVKNRKDNDFSQYDSDFILRYANESSDILDLGSGSGLTVNKIHDKVKNVTAVELYPEFSQFITSSDNVLVINQNIMTYEPERQFDIISLIGVMQSFAEKEASRIYKRYLPYLKKEGRLIVKNQFGVHKDVIISGYSEELGVDYYANYRHWNKEAAMLEACGYTDLEIFDIYPPECNRWENTHFYAIVALS